MSDKKTPEEIIQELNKHPYPSTVELMKIYVDQETAPLKQRIQELELKLQKSDRMAEALEESNIQIEYIHKKFKETGTGNAVIQSNKTALNDYRGIK